jgi:hypothetical protein
MPVTKKMQTTGLTKVPYAPHMEMIQPPLNISKKLSSSTREEAMPTLDRAYPTASWKIFSKPLH